MPIPFWSRRFSRSNFLISTAEDRSRQQVFDRHRPRPDRRLGQFSDCARTAGLALTDLCSGRRATVLRRDRETRRIGFLPVRITRSDGRKALDTFRAPTASAGVRRDHPGYNAARCPPSECSARDCPRRGISVSSGRLCRCLRSEGGCFAFRAERSDCTPAQRAGSKTEDMPDLPCR